MQGERSESCMLRKSKERKKKGEERRGVGEGLRAARRTSHMRTARVASGTRAQRGKEGMQGERSESCMLRKSKERK